MTPIRSHSSSSRRGGALAPLTASLVLLAVLLSLLVVPTTAQAATTLTAAPDPARVGASVTVTGGGFAARKSGTVQLTGGPVVSVRTDARGAFSTTMTVPTTTATSLTVSATVQRATSTTTLGIVQQTATPSPSPSPSPSPTPPPPPATTAPGDATTVYSWDTTLEGWSAEATDAQAARVASPAAHGAGALRLTRTLGVGWGGLRANDGRSELRDLSVVGNEVRAWAFVPAGSPGRNWRVRLEIQDAQWTWRPGPVVALAPGTWTPVTFTLPDDVVRTARRLGAQFDVDDANGTVHAFLDTVQLRPAVETAPVAPVAPVAPAPVPGEDALHRLTRAELTVFTDWLARNGAKGFIGEMGWPNGADGDKWNALAETWFRHANATDLWVTSWAAGEWWGTSYPYSPYVTTASGVLGVARPQATVLERHRSNGTYRRGVNVAGPEFGSPGSLEQVTAFSNVNPGVPGVHYHYDSRASFDYLAGRGVDLVRLPFRWERIQPRLGEPLDTAELQRLRDAVARAHAAGLSVVLDVHNYGAYHLYDGKQGVRRPIGSSQVTHAHFADLWARLSQAFASDPGVVAYGLMNEPVDMGPTRSAGVQAWETASQAAVDAIRARGDRTLVMVSTFQWSHVYLVPELHPVAWIRDPAGNVRYEAHHYPQRSYTASYAEELARAERLGY